MKFVLVGTIAALVDAVSIVRGTGEAEASTARDVTYRSLIQSELNHLTPTCESMCRRVGAYPVCQCPGFNGSPASSEDTRSCSGKYCKPGVDSCPTDNFVMCVKDKTKVSSLLQWGALLKRLKQHVKIMAQSEQGEKRARELADAHDVSHRVFFQAKLNALVPECEKLCKRIGAYPKCQCPGFNGEPASSEDTRSCAGKYCKSGVDQCPTDSFVICVKEKTKLEALLQWGDLMEKYDQGTKLISDMIAN